MPNPCHLYIAYMAKEPTFIVLTRRSKRLKKTLITFVQTQSLQKAQQVCFRPIAEKGLPSQDLNFHFFF